MRAVVLTHGHEDHVGSLPYLMREVRVPLVIATRLTLALVKSKLDEHGLAERGRAAGAGCRATSRSQLGPFRIELVRMAHSIPDAAAVVLETPGGRVVHTGDYKLDHTPVDGQRTDVGRLAEIGSQRRRPPARRLDERRAGRRHRVGARRRRGVPPDLPAAARAGSSSPRSPRTCTGCSRPPTSASTAGARSRSSAARCGRTRTSRATSATWTSPRTRSCGRTSSPSCRAASS